MAVSSKGKNMGKKYWKHSRRNWSGWVDENKLTQYQQMFTFNSMGQPELPPGFLPDECAPFLEPTSVNGSNPPAPASSNPLKRPGREPSPPVSTNQIAENLSDLDETIKHLSRAVRDLTHEVRALHRVKQKALQVDLYRPRKEKVDFVHTPSAPYYQAEDIDDSDDDVTQPDEPGNQMDLPPAMLSSKKQKTTNNN